MVKRVLVTGGAGFVGSHLVRELDRRGYRVIVLDDFSSGRFSNIRGVIDRIALVKGSVLDFELLSRVASRVDVIVHLAAQIHPDRSELEPKLTWEVNTLGTMNVLEASRLFDVPVLNITSSEVYGDTDELPTSENARMRPMHPYGVSKMAADHLARNYADVYGVRVVNIRPFNMYGERQRERGYGLVIPRFTWRALRGLSPIIYGDGEQTRDFTYVVDTVRGLADFVELVAYKDLMFDMWGEAFNFGSGEETRIIDLARMIIEITESDVEPVHAEPRVGEVRRMRADYSRVRKLLGWKPEVSLREGLERFVEWFKRYGAEDF